MPGSKVHDLHTVTHDMAHLDARCRSRAPGQGGGVSSNLDLGARDHARILPSKRGLLRHRQGGSVAGGCAACLDGWMRVLLVTSTFPRWVGDETTPFILQFAQELMRQGCEIDVLAPHAPGARLAEKIDGVSVERFRYFKPESAEDVCYSGGALFNLKKSRVTAAKLPALVGAQWSAIRSRVRVRRYDVVSAHWLLPQGWTAVHACHGGPPVVSTVHGSDVFGLSHPVLTRFKRSALRGSAAVTVNSSATHDQVRDLNVWLPDIRVIPMGIDVSATAEERLVAHWRQFRRPGGPLVAFVGRLIDCKGVDDLLRAAAQTVGGLPQLTVVIAGTGPLREQLEALARDLGLSDRVHFVGWLARNQVTALQTAADIVAMPSRTAADGSREAQGVSLVEAMALGKPIVAGRVGGIPDAISDNVNGLLVPERNPGALRVAIGRLATDAAYAEKLGAAAAVTAQTYAWPIVAARFREVFEDVSSRAS